MKLNLPDAHIAYSDEGDGEAVLFLHGSLSADWLTPAARCLSGYRRIVVHRAGYGRSEDHTDGASVVAQAEHCTAVLAACAVGRAHVVGHSAGAAVALQLAHAHPALAGSLVLLEPAFPRADGEPANPATGRAYAAARRGDWEQAFDEFLVGVCGPDVRQLLRRQLGDAGLREAIASSQYFFTSESRAFSAWDFGSAQLEAISAPTLLVVGGNGEHLGTPHRARAAHIARHLARGEIQVIPGLSHAMPLEDPVQIARVIRDFLIRHPLPSRLT